jgi:anti-anti-sigma factor
MTMQKILIIDDEKPTLSMFRLLLEAYGYSVLTAENGEQGIDLFRKESPPIVLTDIKMPGMDGIAVLKKIKELSPLAEVIVITGHGDMDLAIKALNLDATDFINKPIQKIELDAALQRAQERIKVSGDKEKEITLEVQGDIGIIHIRGNVNSHAEPFLNEVYEDFVGRGLRNVIFDFDHNASINGAGIAVLIQLLTRSKEHGQSVAVSGLSENFRRYFEIVGITHLARIYKTPEEAVLHLRPAST